MYNAPTYLFTRMIHTHSIQGLTDPGQQGQFSTSFDKTSGAVATPASTLLAPSLSFKGAVEGKSYVCICSDPDAVSRAKPIYREFIHWIAVVTFKAGKFRRQSDFNQESRNQKQ